MKCGRNLRYMVNGVIFCLNLLLRFSAGDGSEFPRRHTLAGKLPLAQVHSTRSTPSPLPLDFGWLSPALRGQVRLL
jgi:hypothetical protein